MQFAHKSGISGDFIPQKKLSGARPHFVGNLHYNPKKIKRFHMGEKTKNDTCKGGGHPTTFKPHFTVRKKPKIWSGGSKIWPQNEPFCDFPENLASLEFHLISGFLTFLNENSTISSENKVKYSKISTNLLQNSAGLEN